MSPLKLQLGINSFRPEKQQPSNKDSGNQVQSKQRLGGCPKSGTTFSPTQHSNDGNALESSFAEEGSGEQAEYASAPHSRADEGYASYDCNQLAG